MSNLYLRIKELANLKNVSMAEIERTLNLSNGIISTWRKTNPSIDKVEKVADYFNVSTDYLLGRNEPSKSVTDTDLDEMLDNARSFDGKPMTAHDRELIRSYLKGLYDAK